MPCEENSRLDDIDLRENVLMRVFTYKNWQLLREKPLTVHRLTQFHAQYKYLLMSHSYQAYKEIGHLLGSYNGDDLELLAERYINALMMALKNPSSRKNNSNTLMHLQGYFKKDLSKMEKQALTHAIEQYREGLLPLSAPLTLLKHHLKTYPNEYLEKQVYLNPYPNELNLGYELGEKTE